LKHLRRGHVTFPNSGVVTAGRLADGARAGLSWLARRPVEGDKFLPGKDIELPLDHGKISGGLQVRLGRSVRGQRRTQSSWVRRHLGKPRQTYQQNHSKQTGVPYSHQIRSLQTNADQIGPCCDALPIEKATKGRIPSGCRLEITSESNTK
jgi:hypothetical protein